MILNAEVNIVSFTSEVEPFTIIFDGVDTLRCSRIKFLRLLIRINSDP